MWLSAISLLALVTGSFGLSIPTSPAGRDLSPRQSCENSPTSRDCWGDYSIDTNYYDVVPDTGVTREYWLSLEQGDCSPDGYKRTCMTFNGTVPGPTLTADWGDEMVIHVTNNLQANGSAIHWHGLRQLNSMEYDGVPGVTQCAMAPGQTMAYKFKVSQYGTTWYHSHFSLQYAEGLYGAMVLNGPATANYDIDLGTVTLGDWPHIEAFTLWNSAKKGAPPSMASGLINGTNTWDCSADPTDPNCIGGGKKFEVVFQKDKTHRLRLINVAVEGFFQFSIDGHSLTVIANDLVPIKPYKTDSIQLSSGQRYDVLVEASADPGDYWLRGGWVSACATNQNPDNITGIVRYDAGSTADPTSSSSVTVSETCLDPAPSNLVPHLALNVVNTTAPSTELLSSVIDDYFKWTINSSSLFLDWGSPTITKILNGDTIFPTDYNVLGLNTSSGNGFQWAVIIVEDESGAGLSHPLHLHGHDFWVLDSSTSPFAGTSNFNTMNPPRRDVATLPGGGYIAMAFRLDNPGAWLLHCHIAWHASEGLSLEVVEDLAKISDIIEDKDLHDSVCLHWSEFDGPWAQDDSGI